MLLSKKVYFRIYKRGNMRSSDIKFVILFVLIAVVLLSSISFMSANNVGCCIGSGCKTLVEGNISLAQDNTLVGGADVTVTCNHNGKETTETAVSSSDESSKGNYYVIFCNTICDEKDVVTVEAEKDGLTGTNSGNVQNKGYIDVALVNVPLVPEFGMIAGTLTVLGAVGTFFVIRKKVRISKKHVRIR